MEVLEIIWGCGRINKGKKKLLLNKTLLIEVIRGGHENGLVRTS